jgi:hypothetical protein
MIKTFKQLSIAVNDKSRLGICNYTDGKSVLHKEGSPLVKLIDKKMKELKTQRALEAIYHLVNKLSAKPSCKFCSGLVLWAGKKYNTYCSPRCRANCPEYKATLEKSLIEKYGASTNFRRPDVIQRARKGSKSDEAKRRREATNLERYGYTVATKNETIKDKAKKTIVDKFGSFEAYQEQRMPKVKKTIQERYGVDHYSKHPDYRKKFVKASLERYGVEHPMQNKKVQRKFTQAMKDKYGRPYSMQVQEIFDEQQKSAMTRKRLKIKGKTFDGLQGFEPNAIKYLIKTKGVDPSRIVPHPVFSPSIEWTDAEGKPHVYFPDLLVGSQIIEVKSSYTFNGTARMLDMNKRKCQACLDRGFTFTILVFNGDTFIKRLTRKP